MASVASEPPGVHPDRVSWTPGGPAAELTSQPTVGEALAQRHRRSPGSVVAYLDEGGGTWTRLTTDNLWRAAVAVARELRAMGVTAGRPVALCADTSADLIAAVFGCMLLGAPPFVVEPPLSAARSAEWASRFRHMTGVARPAAVFTAGPAAGLVAATCDALELPVLAQPLRPAQESDAAGLPHPVPPDAPAYLQFSSGTSGSAKAVVLTHRQLLANVAAIGRNSGYVQGDCFVGWLPLHHDMGLVGTLFSTFLHGVPTALMPPLAFALRPERWLRAIHHFRATLSAAPNFAYHLCAGRLPDAALSGLDLTCWRLAFNGAETVGPATLQMWQERMGPHGFAPETMQPCYGMAEVGLAMTLPLPGSPPRVMHVDRAELACGGRVVEVDPAHPHAQGFTAVGRALPGYEVHVVDADGGELPDRHQGNLLLGGPSLTDGYLTADGDHAGNPRDGRLSSGDLGFLADGDLFVTGRAKDVIVIAGRNHLPYGLEEAAAGLAGVRRGAVAAVGVPHPGTGTESLVLVAESPAARAPDKAAAIAVEIERTVVQITGLRPDRVLLARPGTLPRTSSGKLQRHRIVGMIGEGRFS